MMRACGTSGRISPRSDRVWQEVLWQNLVPYPKLRSLLKADLLRKGIPPQGAFPEQGMDETTREWASVCAFLDAFAEGGLLQGLEDTGIRRILEDEAALDADYSTYTEGW